MSNVRQIEVKADDDGQRLDRWLKKNVPELPYGLAQKLIRKGQIRADGKRIKADAKLKAGQEIRIPPLEHKSIDEKVKITDKDKAFIKSMVIYEDADVIALNKPAGLASQGGSKTKYHIDGLLEALTGKDGVKPRLVHRLDKDTSGILLLARNAKAAKAMGDAFKTRKVKKIYWAVVCPAPDRPDGTIKAPLIKAGGNNKERMVVDEKEGKSAITDFIVLESALHSAAFVAFWPRTGRTHQIRVHSELIGCPIVGDKKYARLPEQEETHEARRKAEADLKALNLADRLHLHARRIILPHPSGRKAPLDVTAPLPPELKKTWKALGFSPSLKADPFEDTKS
ncbi:MAG TPA: RluA family pseudouridine synthase [Alphaproteobacteria bacterium]|nr:RluA family pseudouridine synthase [Alphaproteobacteria bacterium]USO04841.1 MAG: RluA family pseudouridine synthase [Rhodospirillales bacterium]HOO80907.1 RluA family pseudouridine synthase [Alphaproteobacteria bacterium]